MIGKALFTVLIVCVLSVHVASRSTDSVETTFETVRGPDQVIEEKPIIVEEKPRVIVEERPHVVVEERPQVSVETVVQNGFRTESRPDLAINLDVRPRVVSSLGTIGGTFDLRSRPPPGQAIILETPHHRFHADRSERKIYGLAPRYTNAKCTVRKCKDSEKCVRRREDALARNIRTQIGKLREEYNRDVAAEHQRHRLAISGKTLHQYFYLAERFNHACEYTSLAIDCPAGFVIEVLSGFYGRQTNTICYNAEIKNFKCASATANQKISSLCNEKQSCKISSSNSVFTDPCVGTYKYTAVKYNCRLASSVQLHACEHSSLSLSCPENYEIEVLSGFYGRETNSICFNRDVKDFRCRSGRATEVIRSMCNNRQGCTVASSNSVFGDPCVGTFKYMTVTYRCRVSRAIQQKHDRERAEISRDHYKITSKLKRDFDAKYGDLQQRLSAAHRGTDQCVQREAPEL